jgi:hypothetical protein
MREMKIAHRTLNAELPGNGESRAQSIADPAIGRQTAN